jgi:hypothetical protein
MSYSVARTEHNKNIRLVRECFSRIGMDRWEVGRRRRFFRIGIDTRNRHLWSDREFLDGRDGGGWDEDTDMDMDVVVGSFG